MATIKDVAKEAGVSVATVSRVVNKSPKASQASIEAVTKAMAKLGYRPNANARALVSQSSNTVGVLVADVSDPFFGSMVKAIDHVAREQGKQILIGNGYHDAEDERNALELLINSRCEAIIVHAKGLSDEELTAYVKEVPGLVVINRHIPQIATRCIALDNFKGAYLATDYLIRQGHSKIACIASSRDIEDTQARIEGYLAALKDNGIALSKSYIEYGEPNSDGGESAMTNLLSKSLDMSAVFAYNDNMAAGAMMVLEQNGIAVPKQMSVVGFDDGILARFLNPGLTTVRYPIEMMAERAARQALSLSRGEMGDEETAVFSPTLVRRNSVASHS
ncbi:substrate-binding domain-containing protein [Enterovibrio paralichthyis]|uniref:substrate-binding domain-containing protein n=1 Tax=Enterovibrio paralichthyis TaxID=2853805 RepID=UPI001C451887|nr:substrate-binding domain-containing protein [Enterovibrio paralichthyis]MBV7298659.1 substrate-binding domain-containing protein [Enterovibrio paralichthyis]